MNSINLNFGQLSKENRASVFQKFHAILKQVESEVLEKKLFKNFPTIETDESVDLVM